MRTSAGALLATAMILGLSACEGGPHNLGDPRRVEVTLSTTLAGVGAVRLRISGGTVTNLEAPGLRVFSAPSTGTVVLAGNVTSGMTLSFCAPAEARAGDYSVSILEVAQASTYALLNSASMTAQPADRGECR